MLNTVILKLGEFLSPRIQYTFRHQKTRWSRIKFWEHYHNIQYAFKIVCKVLRKRKWYHLWLMYNASHILQSVDGRALRETC